MRVCRCSNTDNELEHYSADIDTSRAQRRLRVGGRLQWVYRAVPGGVVEAPANQRPRVEDQGPVSEATLDRRGTDGNEEGDLLRASVPFGETR